MWDDPEVCAPLVDRPYALYGQFPVPIDRRRSLTAGFSAEFVELVFAKEIDRSTPSEVPLLMSR